MSFANNESLANATSLNNKAVSLIEAGDDSTAVEILKRSVDLMKVAVKIDQSSRQGPISSISCNELPINVFHSATEPIRAMHNRKWFLCNKALYFDMDLISSMSRFPGDIEAMAAVTIFNLALVYHRNVLLGNSKCIEKAIPLYSLALNILGGHYSSSLTSTTIKLAAINNTAQLRHASGQYKEMAKRLGQLTVVIRRSKETFPSLLHNQGELVRGLLCNLVLLKPQRLSPAA